MSPIFLADDVPDLTGKVALVTGPKRGIGLETVYLLARKGCTVYLAGRGLTGLEEAITTLKSRPGLESATLIPLELDLSTTTGAKAAAAAFPGEKLDILIANAGFALGPAAERLSSEGWEPHFQTNHLGHFAYVNGLLPVLEKSPEARIVVTASEAHKFVERLDYDALRSEVVKRFGPMEYVVGMKRYGASKLANILFVRELERRLQERGVRNVWVNAVHPGSFGLRLLERFIKTLGSCVGFSTRDGAMTQVYVATARSIVDEDIRGQYWAPVVGWTGGYLSSKVVELKGTAGDATAAKELWEVSEEAVEAAGRG